MKKTVLIIIASFLFVEAFSQVIEGTVFDKTSREVISNASVYFQGTSTGTLTDLDGRFRLDISKFRALPLTVSALGYYSNTLSGFITGQPLEVFLEPKIFEFDEVIVNAKSQARERKTNMAILRKEFLGATANAFSCRITNEKDIRFRYSENGDTLKAFSLAPIHIINNALGFQIDYFLDDFRYCQNQNSKYFSYKGTILFTEDSARIADEKKSIERRRKFAYLGSRMHFFRSLWTDSLKSAGFSTCNDADMRLDYKSIVFQQDAHTKYLSTQNKLGISYYNKQPTSRIILLKDRVYFDPSGYFDESAIIWEGEMSRPRIADTLPYDYVFKE